LKKKRLGLDEKAGEYSWGAFKMGRSVYLSGIQDQETKRQAVLNDRKGKKWYRASNQIRRYYPRLDFTKEYLDLMKKIDAQVPTGREIEQRFVEQVHQAPSFVALRIAEKLMRIRKTVGFVPSDKPLRFNL
jgi:hypothetical protein